MISERCFSDEHIRRKARELRANDPLLLEKSIHALALLGHLVDSGLPFIFKGGTSVMLLLDPIRRLSIDIDIQCGAARREVDAVLDSIANKPPFIRSNATGALNVLVEAGAIGELHALSVIDQWKERHSWG